MRKIIITIVVLAAIVTTVSHPADAQQMSVGLHIGAAVAAGVYGVVVVSPGIGIGVEQAFDDYAAGGGDLIIWEDNISDQVLAGAAGFTVGLAAGAASSILMNNLLVGTTMGTYTTPVAAAVPVHPAAAAVGLVALPPLAAGTAYATTRALLTTRAAVMDAVAFWKGD